MKAEEYDEISRESTPLETSPRGDIYSPAVGAPRPSKAQNVQAVLNTMCLCFSAVFLAIIAARGGGGSGGDGRPSLATDVPGLPRRSFFLDETRENWDPAGTEDVPMPLWHHVPTGRVWADVSTVLDTDLLLVEQLTQGVGIRQSPAYGGLTNSWDAGRPLSQDLVQFRRVGPKVLLVALQTVHRASDPDVQSSVEQSFAQSVLFSFAAHESEDGRVGIDLTELVLRDARGNGLVEDLNGLGGSYVLDVAKSIINPSKTKARTTFSCLEANITAADTTGGLRKFGKSLADPAYITIAIRRTFVLLPPLDGPDAYTPRPFIPKSSFSSISFTDEAAPLLSTRTKKYITRHRIGGVDPGRAPQDGAGILYYVDRGAPEPMLSALVEGVNFWDQAFQAAGYPAGTFRAEICPEDIDPYDIDQSFNFVEWVHRDHRSWSYGPSVVDPRTGEILKGHVVLGSLRGRQDALMGLGLIQPYRHASEGSREAVSLFAEIEAAVLQRHRQLAAHEVGHTLGLAHNYMGTTLGADASVMDYPAPVVEIDPSGTLLETAAYVQEIGEFDKFSITYGYGQLPASARGSESATLGYLQRLIEQAEREKNYVFGTDQDNGPRPTPDSVGGLYGFDWRSSQWDNGMDPAAALEQSLNVREIALSTLDERTLQPYEPYSKLRDLLPIVWLWHRYEVEVASKTLGGVQYQHVVKGGANAAAGRSTPTEARVQWASLQALLRSVEPSSLTMSQRLVDSVLPPAFGYSASSSADPDMDWLGSRMGDLFDPLAAAEMAAAMTFDYLLTVQRSTRLQDQNPDDLQGETALPSLRTVLRETTQSVIPTTGVSCRFSSDDPGGRVMLVVANVYADRLIKLHAASHFRIKQQVKEAVLTAADACGARAALCADSATGVSLEAEWQAIESALRDGKQILTDELRLPQGSPI